MSPCLSACVVCRSSLPCHLLVVCLACLCLPVSHCCSLSRAPCLLYKPVSHLSRFVLVVIVPHCSFPFCLPMLPVVLCVALSHFAPSRLLFTHVVPFDFPTHVVWSPLARCPLCPSILCTSTHVILLSCFVVLGCFLLLYVVLGRSLLCYVVLCRCRSFSVVLCRALSFSAVPCRYVSS